MQKPKRTYQKPLKIEMDFEEALERFSNVEKDEAEAEALNDEADIKPQKPKTRTEKEDT